MDAPRIQNLLPRHFKILELAAAGHDYRTIAKTLDMAPTSVSLVVNSPMAQAELARMRRESKESTVLGLDRSAIQGKARSILEQASEKAANVQEELLVNDDPSIRLRSSQAILDRVFGKGDEAKFSVSVNITTEQLTLLHLALKESRNAAVLPADPPAPVDSEVEHGCEELCECQSTNEGTSGDPQNQS